MLPDGSCSNCVGGEVTEYIGGIGRSLAAADTTTVKSETIMTRVNRQAPMRSFIG